MVAALGAIPGSTYASDTLARIQGKKVWIGLADILPYGFVDAYEKAASEGSELAKMFFKVLGGIQVQS